MANMGYCRFENTLGDLQDCQEHIGDYDLSETEMSAREEMIRICVEIALDFGQEINVPRESRAIARTSPRDCSQEESR